MSLIKNSQASFTAGELAPSLHSRVDLAKYRTGAKKLQNWIIHPHGGVSNRPGLGYVGTVGNEDYRPRLFPFQASSNDSYILEFGHQYMRVYRNGALVLTSGGSPFQLALPYAASALRSLVIEQSNDVLTVTHEGYAPREIARYDHDDWRVETLAFAPPSGGPSIASVSPGISMAIPAPAGENPNDYYIATAYTYAVSAVMENGAETVKSAPVSTTNDIRFAPANYNIVAWDAVPGAIFYNVYKAENGYYGLIGTTEGTTFRDLNYKPNLQESPPQGKNPFNGTGKFPRASAFFQQRRLFGGTASQPQTTWGSVSGNYNNFSSSRPAKDNDAFEFTIAGRKLQKIRYYVAMKDLILFTESGEWRVSGPDNGILTPSSIKADPQSEYGIGDVPPLVAGDQILFVLRDGKQVRDLGYKFESDNYAGSDLTILSHHLFETKRVREWGHQRYPNGIIWCIMDDGTVNALTYMREHEVWGWSQITTDGTFESVAVVQENDVDVPYFVVRRLVNGTLRRFIERMDPVRPTMREASFFVDAGLSYSGVPKSTFAGLDHLEGRTVVGLADGAVVGMDGELTVTGGSVTLPFSASTVHLGLGYESLLETLSFTLGDRVTEGVIRAVGEVTLSVKDTSGLEVGPSFADMNEFKARAFEDYGVAPELQTGSDSIPAPSDYNRVGGVCIRQRYPLPATVLAISPDIDYAG